MDSFEFNKIAGALLGTVLFAVGLGIVAEAIYSSEEPAKAGYELPVGKPEASGAKPAAAAVPLPVLLAKADVTKGQAATKVCQACHNFEKGAGIKVGPPLYGVVGRPKGSVAGFDYSAGLKAKGGNWDFAALDDFLTNPKAYISGTKMGYAGEPSPEKRADIEAYLRSLSDSPVALPEVAAAPAAPAPAAAAPAPAPAAPAK
ncbi:MAG: cytochrome c family protein [Beijerinckiaceae bacterium]|nr:cytochrome c family protein [Beijerinckiaceae bacterium]